MPLEKLNTNAWAYRKKPSKFSDITYTVRTFFKQSKIYLFGSTGTISPVVFKPITFLPVIKKENIKIGKIIKFKKKHKKYLLWKQLKPYAIIFSKYLLILCSCLIIILGIAYTFSDRLLKIFIEQHNIFQTDKVIYLIERETMHITANFDDFLNRIAVVEEALKIKQYPKLAPKPHIVRKYEILNSNGKVKKYIVK